MCVSLGSARDSGANDCFFLCFVLKQVENGARRPWQSRHILRDPRSSKEDVKIFAGQNLLQFPSMMLRSLHAPSLCETKQTCHSIVGLDFDLPSWDDALCLLWCALTLVCIDMVCFHIGALQHDTPRYSVPCYNMP
jgi:hypothetical protein